jgi:hypothetical protein
MKIIKQMILITISFLNLSISHAATFYVDPIRGNMANDGSISAPWKTFAEVISSNLITTKDKTGVILNPNAPIKPGDKIVLRTGYHGFIQIKNAFNDNSITVVAAANQKPTLSGLEVMSAKNWNFSNLTISPSFSSTALTGKSIVTVGENNFLGKCYNIVLSNSHIYSFDDAKVTSATDWLTKLTNAKEGIILGRYGASLHSINNYINNVSFGIEIMSPNSKVRANIITDFSKDGIRTLANNLLIENNVIKNNYVIDGNHPDGIQGFSFNPKLVLSNISLVGNIILNRDKKENIYSAILPVIPTYSGTMQGIGFFDGPIEKIQVDNNVIMSFAWPGLSLYDSNNGAITNNIVFTPGQINTIASRITLGSKNNGGNNTNTLLNNIAHDYIVESSLGLTRSGNKTIAPGTGKVLFTDRLNLRIADINTLYGATHPVSNQPRISESFMLNGTPSIF